jgi:hypothetical protein
MIFFSAFFAVSAVPFLPLANADAVDDPVRFGL